MTGLIGAFVGGFIASHVPGSFLKIGFGLAILAGAIRMLTAKPLKVEKEPVDNILTYTFWGLPLGIVSGIIGIGRGSFVVIKALKKMRREYSI